MNPEQILAEAREALRQGADPAAVDERIASRTQYPNIFALRMAVESVQDRAVADAGMRATEGRETRAQQVLGGVGDFLRMGAHGLTAGFSDEIVGALAGDEVRDRARQRIDDLRTVQPGASMAAEIAGGLIIPGAGGRTAMAQGGRTLRAAGRGALAGGAQRPPLPL